MRIFLAVCLLLLSIIAPAFAETTDLNTVVVKASRSEDTVGGLNKDVTLITQEDIANSPQLSLPELLGKRAGIYGIQFGNIKNSQVDIHAFGESSPSDVLVLIDGRRTNQIDLSGIDWAQIDVNSIDHIEVLKGSATVLYGDNANAGVINIITKKGKKDTKPSLTLTNEIGNYQTQKHAFNVSGGLHTLDYQLSYNHDETTGYRANSDYHADDFNSHLGYDPTDVFGVDFAQGYHQDWYQLPGALFISNIDQFGRRGVRSSLNNDHGNTTDSHFDVTPRLKFTSGASEGEFSLFTSERRRYNEFATGSGTSIYETKYLIDSYEFQPKLIVTTPLSASLNNKATGGYDYFYGKNKRHSGYIQDAGFGSGYPQDAVFISKSTHGVYLLDELVFDEKWLFNAGARGSWSDYVFNQTEVLKTKSEQTPTTQGYEGGLGYKYNPKSKVYINYTHSYRLPAVDEFFSNAYDFGSGLQGGLNPDLTYQSGNEYEWGVKDETFTNTKLGLNFFINQYKNEIYYDPTGGASGFGANSNYDGRTRHYGVSTAASHAFLDGKIEPFTDVTLQQATFRGGKYAGSVMPLVPNHMAHAGVILRPLTHMSTTFSVENIGKSFAVSDETNTHAKLKGYTTADWNIKYALQNLEVWLALRNVTNVKYYNYEAISGSGEAGYYPAPGRNVTAGVKVKF